MITWRWIVLRVFFLCVHQSFQRDPLLTNIKCFPSQKHAKSPLVRHIFSRRPLPSVSHPSFCPKYSLPTYNHLQTPYYYNHFIQYEMQMFSRLQVCHAEGFETFSAIWWEPGGWRRVSSASSWFLFFVRSSQSHHGRTMTFFFFFFVPRGGVAVTQPVQEFKKRQRWKEKWVNRWEAPWQLCE